MTPSTSATAKRPPPSSAPSRPPTKQSLPLLTPPSQHLRQSVPVEGEHSHQYRPRMLSVSMTSQFGGLQLQSFGVGGSSGGVGLLEGGRGGEQGDEDGDLNMRDASENVDGNGGERGESGTVDAVEDYVEVERGGRKTARHGDQRQFRQGSYDSIDRDRGESVHYADVVPGHRASRRRKEGADHMNEKGNKNGSNDTSDELKKESGQNGKEEKKDDSFEDMIIFEPPAMTFHPGKGNLSSRGGGQPVRGLDNVHQSFTTVSEPVTGKLAAMHKKETEKNSHGSTDVQGPIAIWVRADGVDRGDHNDDGSLHYWRTQATLLHSQTQVETRIQPHLQSQFLTLAAPKSALTSFTKIENPATGKSIIVNKRDVETEKTNLLYPAGVRKSDLADISIDEDHPPLQKSQASSSGSMGPPPLPTLRVTPPLISSTSVASKREVEGGSDGNVQDNSPVAKRACAAEVTTPNNHHSIHFPYYRPTTTIPETQISQLQLSTSTSMAPPPLPHAKSSTSSNFTSSSPTLSTTIPTPSELTWHDSEITGHLLLPADVKAGDDGTGINGIGFRPTATQAFARSQKRRRQIEEWKRREEREERERRRENRRGGGSERSAKGSDECGKNVGSAKEERMKERRVRRRESKGALRSVTFSTAFSGQVEQEEEDVDMQDADMSGVLDHQRKSVRFASRVVEVG